MEIQEIKQKLSLSEIIKHYGYKADKHNRINCPFHEDKTPSMQLYYKTQTCYCFSGNCKIHGKSLDVIDFVMYQENISKHEAIEKCKQMILGTPSTKESTITLTKAAILQKMFMYFKNAVHNSLPTKKYLETRKLDFRKIEVGYNAGQFHHGSRKEEALIKSCIAVGLLQDVNLVARNGEKAYKPFGKYCIVFALRNKENQIAGLYFRSTINNEHQKHYYLKERSGIYPKYPEANTEKLILTESVIDAASLLQIKSITEEYSVIAAYGSNGLNEEMKTAIKELSELQEIIFAFDNDEAGNKATEKYANELKIENEKLIITKIELPCKDVNETLIAHEEAIFTHLLETRTLIFLNENINKESTSNFKPETKNYELKTSNSKLQTIIPLTNQQINTSTNYLNSNNPDSLTYQTDQLHITLLGGINLQSLDRMRVTIKITNNPPISYSQSIRHNVDLYHDEAVEKFIRRAAEKLEIGTSVINTAIAALTEQLEKYRLSQIEKKSTGKLKKIKILTPEEKEAAINFLKTNNLLQTTNNLLGKTGIIGEETNRILMYLIFTSRKRENPLHIVSLGSSGIGKTYLQEKVSECIPEEDKKEITMLSENAFYYFGQEELKNKLILIEDLDGAEEVLYPLRELQSKKRITKTVPLKDSKGNLKTITLEVEGPVCVSGCTTREKLYEDNANRSFLIYIDESKEQDQKIMDYQRKLSAGQINKQAEETAKEQLKNVQRVLQPITVKNPYAPSLQLPENILKPRRTNAHYLQCIEIITYYKQYQRNKKTDEATGEVYIETTLEDVQKANELMKEVLLRKSDELTGACRNFLEQLKTHVTLSGVEAFYAKEIRSSLRINPSNLKRYLIELHRNGYIKLAGGSKRMGFEYQVSDYNEYEKLKSSISSVLDEIYQKLKNGSMVQNGSLSQMDHSSQRLSVS